MCFKNKHWILKNCARISDHSVIYSLLNISRLEHFIAGVLPGWISTRSAFPGILWGTVVSPSVCDDVWRRCEWDFHSTHSRFINSLNQIIISCIHVYNSFNCWPLVSIFLQFNFVEWIDSQTLFFISRVTCSPVCRLETLLLWQQL